MILDSDSLGKMKKSTISLAKALEFSTDARVICHAQHPNLLLHANKAWTLLTKYEQHEIEGKNLSCLHGPLTDKDRIKQMMHDVMFSGFGLTEVISYDKYDVPFVCKVSIQPVISQNYFGEYLITHYMGVLEKKAGEYVGFCNKDGQIANELQPLIFLSKEEEEAYDWVINADKQLDQSPAQSDDESQEWDEEVSALSRSQRRKQLAQLYSSNNKPLRKRNAQRQQHQPVFSNHQMDYDDSEEDRTMNKSELSPSKRPRRRVKSSQQRAVESDCSPVIVYHIDAIEFLPPLSPSSETNMNVNNSPSPCDLDTVSATSHEDSYDMGTLMADSRKRASSSLSAELELGSHSSSSVCETLFAGQRLRSICVDSCKEKRLRLESRWSRPNPNPNSNSSVTPLHQEDIGLSVLTDVSMHSSRNSESFGEERHLSNAVRSGQGGSMILE